jgi:transcriptional regulator with XRE-family HTH domain
MTTELSSLVAQARSLLGMTQPALAEHLGSSRRTVQRWEIGHARPLPSTLVDLARSVLPLDRGLAETLHAIAAETCIASPFLGTIGPLVTEAPPAPPPPEPRPSPAPSPPQPVPVPVAVLVDAVVCASAEAMGATPQAIRPALYAAFARARDLDLAPSVVADALAPPLPTAGAKKSRQ